MRVRPQRLPGAGQHHPREPRSISRAPGKSHQATGTRWNVALASAAIRSASGLRARSLRSRIARRRSRTSGVSPTASSQSVLISQICGRKRRLRRHHRAASAIAQMGNSFRSSAQSSATMVSTAGGLGSER